MRAALAVAFLLALCCLPAQAGPISIPLVIENDSFENFTNDGTYNRPDDWVLASGAASQITVTGNSSNSNDGDRHVRSTANGPLSDELYQAIDVSTYASPIDEGLVTASFTGFGAAYQAFSGGSTGDYTQMRLRFLDGTASEIGDTGFTGLQNTVQSTWEQLSILDEPVPVGTRSVEVWFTLYRSAGVSTDAALDGLVTGQLTAYVPEPATGVLCLTGLGAVLLLVGRRARRGTRK